MKNSFDRSTLHALVLAIACIGVTPVVLAGPSSIADCHAIRTDADRLACYDRLTGRDETQPPSASPPAPAAGTITVPAPVQAKESAASEDVAKERQASYLQQSWGLAPGARPYGLSLYHSNYILLARYSNDVNNRPFTPTLISARAGDEELNATEAKFQVSAKLRFWTTEDRRWSLYAAYTQQNQWQVYNSGDSRPFRETNYMPELFVSYAPDLSFGGVQLRLLNFGYTHQSNGRSDPLSRSWDRLFVEAALERGDFALFARAWYRIPEDENKDNNPDIADYMGYGELRGVYRWEGNSFAGAVRGNVGTGKGALQLGWFSRPFIGPVRGYVQLFSGYGESLIDYNWNQTTIGAGIALSDGP